MKELLKSKVMVGFAIFLLGVVYMNASYTKNFDNNTRESEQEMIVMNLQ